MLKKHERFVLHKNGGHPKRDRLYGTKTWKYLKYIIVPALILFILFCILINVNFSKDIYNDSLNKEINKIKHYDTNSQKDTLKATMKPITKRTSINTDGTQEILKEKVKQVRNNNQEIMELQENQSEAGHINREDVDMLKQKNSSILIDVPKTPLASAIKCKEYKENCTLYCSDGTVSFIDENLGEFQYKCPGAPLNLMVEKCEFNFGTLMQSFFHGSFSLGYLAISECNLKIISDAAFNTYNVRNLQTLILRNNQLTTLQYTSFEGLNNLLHFEFKQAPLSEIFKGVGFFKPFAKSLKKAIMQPSINDSSVMDPLDWWQGLLLISLTYLDLSNTKLLGALNSNTFQPFESLESLILYNCNLLTITSATFDFISSSLKYLDLRFNHLQTLDSEFLQTFATTSIEMDLRLNEWHCECDTEMLQYFMQYDVQINEGIICSTPEKWQQMEVSQVLKECGESETTTIITTTSTNCVTITQIPPNSSTSPSTTTTTTEMTTTGITETTTTEASSTTTTTEKLTTFSVQPITTTTEMTTDTNTTEASSTTTTTEKPTTFSVQPTPTTTEMTTTGITETITSTTTEKPTTFSVQPTSYTTTTTEVTTNPPLDLTNIRCYSSNEKIKTFSIAVARPKASFVILSHSFNSLKINIQEVAGDLQMYSILYFTNYSDYLSVNVATNSKPKSNIIASVYINDLKPITAYVFCLVKEPVQKISPFDCRSHFLEAVQANTTWLLLSDKVWFIAVIITIALLLFFISIFIVYIVMRSYPQWFLKGKKGILPVHNNSRKILILSKRYRGSECISHNPQTASLYLKSIPPIQKPADCDIESSVYSSEHSVPTARAPKLPPIPADPRITNRFNISSCSPMAKCRHQVRHNPSPQTTSLYLKSIPPIKRPADYDIENSVYSSEHSAPIVRAPMLPPIPIDPRISNRFNISSCSPLTRRRQHSSHNMDYLNVIENDPDYQTIDHYEAIN